MISEEEIKKNNEAILESLPPVIKANKHGRPFQSGSGKVFRNMNEATVEEILFLMDIERAPEKLLKERYKDLGFSIDKGSRIKTSVIDKKFILEDEVKGEGRGRNRYRFTLTRKAYETLKLSPKKKGKGRGGPEHRGWVEEIARGYKESHETRVEFPITNQGDCIDLFCWNETEKIGIEIALPPIDTYELRNIAKCLKFRCTEIIVFVKSLKDRDWLRDKAENKFTKEEMNKVKFKILSVFDN